MTGALRVLGDVLALANPTAFARNQTITAMFNRDVRESFHRHSLVARWPLERIPRTEAVAETGFRQATATRRQTIKTLL